MRQSQRFIQTLIGGGWAAQNALYAESPESASFSVWLPLDFDFHFHRLLRTKVTVTLYVGIGNPAAKVYHRVGFVGLDARSDPIEGIENWTEIGFDRSKVELGHWWSLYSIPMHSTAHIYPVVFLESHL